MKKIVASAAVAVSLLSAPAFAQDQQQDRQQAPFAWRQVAISGGCTIGIPSTSSLGPTITLTWDHACTAGQPVSGDGTLRMSTGDGRAVTLAGTFIAGVPNGAVVLTAYDASGAERVQRTEEYNMGCDVATGAVCQPYRPS